jgi:hypothetical protein
LINESFSNRKFTVVLEAVNALLRRGPPRRFISLRGGWDHGFALRRWMIWLQLHVVALALALIHLPVLGIIPEAVVAPDIYMLLEL